MSASEFNENVLSTNENMGNRDPEMVIAPDVSTEESKAEASTDDGNTDALPEYPYTLNDAQILGPISEHVASISLRLGCGKNRQDKRWPANQALKDYYDLIVGLSHHRVGPKDGAAFIQGTAIGNERRVPAIDALYVMGLDIDSGIFPQSVVEKLTRLGLSAIIYTTHSHMKGDTFLLESSFNQFCNKHRLDQEMTVELVRQFLVEERHWEQWIADTVEVGDVAQTAEGKGWWLSHDPMPKFRVVFPLNEPFVIAKQMMSQLDAIKLWKAKIIGLAKSLELPIDEACLDPSRLFYLPRHDKGRPFGIWVTGGDALDFQAIQEGKVRGRDQTPVSNDVWSRAAADLAAKGDNALVVDGNFSLKRWAREVAADFDIATMFRTAAPDKVRTDQNTSKVTVECPFDHYHSTAGDIEDQGCFVQSPSPEIGINTFVFSCSHNSCKDRDRLEFVAEAVNQGWFTRDDLSNPDFRMSLAEVEKEFFDVAKLLDEAVEAVKEVDRKDLRAVQKAVEEQIAILVNADAARCDITMFLENLKTLRLVSAAFAKDLVATATKKAKAKKAKESARPSDGGAQMLFGSEEEGVAALNQFAAIVALPGKTRIVIEQPQESGKQIKPNLMDPSSARTLLAHYSYIDSDGNEQPLFDKWIRHHRARRYLSATFDPTGKATNEYNFWKGFDIDPNLKARWDLMKRHVLLYICGGNPAHAIWYLSWLAQSLQEPTKLMGTSLLIKANEGMGKSTMGGVLRTILGTHFSSIAQREQLTGKFNKHLANKLHIFAEEATWSKDHEAASVLKDMITNPRMNLEGKGFDIETDYPNYARLTFLTNEDYAIPATSESRRFMCLIMIEPGVLDSPEHKAYFDALYAEIDAGAAAGMFDFLLQYDHTRVDLRRPPKTALFRQQVAANLNPSEEWFVGCVEAGAFYDSQYAPATMTGDWAKESVFVDATQVFASYASKVRGYRGQRGSDTACGTFLKKLSGVKRVGSQFQFPSKAELEEWLIGKGWMQPSVSAPPQRWDGDWAIVDSLPDPVMDALPDDDPARKFYDAGREMEIEATLVMVFEDDDPAEDRALTV
ncbi:primase-helicase family protein [Methylosinus sp. LW4]|uniref:primase-helicase family protein n=1 Tax=Methylosinus sp. LW4 TaxID=136993 RepID=UPI00039B6499|nr:primase-helicase family protein [Methylosinus sp. LW4]